MFEFQYSQSMPMIKMVMDNLNVYTKFIFKNTSFCLRSPMIKNISNQSIDQALLSVDESKFLELFDFFTLKF